MLLTRKSDSAPSFGPAPAQARRRRLSTMDRRTFLKRSGLAAGAGAFASQLAVQRDRARAGAEGRRQGREEAHRVHALLGRLRHRRRGAERRVGAAGTGVRFAAQPGRALRQGRLGARARHDRAFAPSEESDEAGERQVQAHLLGRRRSTRSATSCSRSGRRSVRTRSTGSASSKHNNEQSYLMRKFVSLFGTNNCRPPGAHLPLDHGRRRRQHLGLRRDDQLLQRHAEHEVRAVHRLERGRGAPGVDAARAAREGNRRQDDRRRSALHAHRGQGRPVRAHPLRHRHPVPVRHALPHLQERLGRQAVHQRPRLRHGQGQGRGHGSGRPTRSRRSAACPRREVLQGRRDHGQEPARRPSSGAWGRRSTRSATRWCARPASCSSRSATSASSGGGANIFRGHDNVQGATDVGPNPDSLPGYYGIATGSWKHWASVWGVDYEWIKKQYAEGMMEKPGMTVSRWIDGVMEKNDADRPGPEPARDGVLGPCAEQPDARQGHGRGDEEARPDGRHRPVSVGHRGDVRDGAQGRRVPAAGGDAVRDLRLVHGVQPLAPVAREGDRAAVRVEARPHADGEVRAEVRLRQGADQELRDEEGQGRLGRAHARVHPEGDQQGHVDHRLHRPVAGAAEAAHAEHVDVRREDRCAPAAGRATATTSDCRGRATGRRS